MRHRLVRVGKEDGGGGRSPGWPEVCEFTVGAVVVVVMTRLTGSVQDGVLAVTAVSTATRALPRLGRVEGPPSVT